MSVTAHIDRAWRVTLHRQSETFLENNPNFFEELGNAVEITQLRVQFKIEKTNKPEPNKCELTISNLSENTRALCQKRPLRVVLEAGYQNQPRLLFTGDVMPSPGSRMEGTDWETKLLLGDGLRAYANARVNRSYKTGTTVHTILRDAAASMGLQLPRDIDRDPGLKATIATGEVLMGFSSDELDRLLAPYGYRWSIQNSQLQVLKDEGFRDGEERELSTDTGMIEAPSQGNPDSKGKPANVVVKNLLYPELVPGGKVRVRSRGALSGLYKIVIVRHEGDTHGGPWYTTVELTPP